MNKWFRRAVGSVGVAGGVLLLGAGTAHAHVSVPAAMDPQQLHGLVDDLFKPTGGPNNQGLSLDRVGLPTREVASTPVPGVLGALPINDATGASDLGGLGVPAPDSALPGLLSSGSLASSVTGGRLPVVQAPTGELPVPGLAPVADATGLLAGGPQALVRQVVDTVHPGADGSAMIGDDYVDQATYAAPLPAAGGVLPGVLSNLPVIGDLPVVGDIPALPALPAVGELPAPGQLPVVGDLPGVGNLPALPAVLPAQGAADSAVTTATRTAERPVTTESLPTEVVPAAGLPIFDSLPEVPVLSESPKQSVLDRLDGVLPGRHRASSVLPGADAVGAVSHALPAADQLGHDRRLHVIDATLDPTTAADLPIFGSVVQRSLSATGLQG